MADLQYASCLDDSNHAEAGRAFLLSGRYSAVKVRKKMYVNEGQTDAVKHAKGDAHRKDWHKHIA
ncbi:hypothetical protein [Collinsella sp. UBA1693]|uniref:hypothetical protein n=1 Tax=Collinsella sp. UBA1693 TaxID=1946385 RepID=UPI002579A026|nr:hypothetical protein [Collinsella sp. UBA1693]